MRSEHRAPLIASIVVVLACAGVMAHGIRTDALVGLARLAPFQSVAAPMVEPKPVPTEAPRPQAAPQPSTTATEAAGDAPAAPGHHDRTPARSGRQHTQKPAQGSQSQAAPQAPSTQQTAHQPAQGSGKPADSAQPAAPASPATPAAPAAPAAPAVPAVPAPAVPTVPAPTTPAPSHPGSSTVATITQAISQALTYLRDQGAIRGQGPDLPSLPGLGNGSSRWSDHESWWDDDHDGWDHDGRDHDGRDHDGDRDWR